MNLGSLSPDENEVTLGTIWGPTYGSAVDVIATNATGPSGVLANPQGGGGPAASTMISASATGGVAGHPLIWWGLAAAAILGLWALFQHVGPPEERKNFSNLELSFVNVLLLSLVPLIGIPLWKAIANLVPFIPAGAKTFVNSA